MMKDEITKYIENQTAFLDLDNISEVFTAKNIGLQFEIKRNTVSHYLNQLNEQGIIIKINTRPVYFFHKNAFETQFYTLSKNIYRSLDELKEEQPLFQKRNDMFSLLIGNDASLARSIEQLKAALYYPENGLPVLLTGESGTGKSYMVKIIYQYCLANDLIKEDGQLITLNCAQYANNPELLTSHLFGHAKGAFTGADEDHKGVFEEANGGILFLDEVHRLNAEGQEKLFTYLDQGVIYRMGETNMPRKVSTRIFFATTEDLNSVFLSTFIRRIPVQIQLPSLEQRTQNERLEMIYNFFIKERAKIRKVLLVSSQVIHLLKTTPYQGNIGKLKNVVKVTVAKAFSEQKDAKHIHITIYHLPPDLLTKAVFKASVSTEENINIDETTTIENLSMKKKPEELRIIRTYERLLANFKKSELNITAIDEDIKKEVENLFDFLLFETDREKKHELLLFMTQYVRDTLKQMESSYQIIFNGNSIYAISYYLFQRSSVRWQPEDVEVQSLIKEFKQAVIQTYPMLFQYTERMLSIIKPRLDIEVFDMDLILLTLYFSQLGLSRESNFAKAIIVAHGYATASSIANVANRLLGKNIFESFDMPIDTTPQKIAEEIVDYTEKNDVSNGLVILVDMGSLKEIYEYFPQQLSVPVMIMNNLTTPLAIAIGENIQKSINLSELAIHSFENNKPDWKIIYPHKNKNKALLTTCFTGIGTATKISKLLEKSLPINSPLKVLPFDYQTLHEQKEKETVFSLYEVVGIVGTANPMIQDIPYLSLEELISGKGAQHLREWLMKDLDDEKAEQFNNRLIRNFSLDKVIDSVTILDTDKVMAEIELFMRILEELTEQKIKNERKLALYVHVSCLIERLIRNVPIETYSGDDTDEKCRKEQLARIKEAFSVIEEDYSVKIPNSELKYIHDILFQKLDLTMIKEEF
ncbi:transcription antiterminator BglG [Virgibacillus pantothenticus]|nr:MULTISPECIES: sigma-54-dependent transcriptional regulator [Virgibacillus]MBS7428857.1 sigma 54-interacting transcriptional regulator [Virgibacillus sp. 19R1-5]MED3737168.1 sigma 54-interacting transcriptional regulator [Virgibacillus pantothenticus]QTY15077.1 sigma 54-interacting transcriptional regulator [Virgibacillus pantothenticus]GIP62787.1 transcription antiterminator BglG [Virgibacillus pantothenticus]